jgi:hypothetical protein
MSHSKFEKPDKSETSSDRFLFRVKVRWRKADVEAGQVWETGFLSSLLLPHIEDSDAVLIFICLTSVL